MHSLDNVLLPKADSMRFKIQVSGTFIPVRPKKYCEILTMRHREGWTNSYWCDWGVDIQSELSFPALG